MPDSEEEVLDRFEELEDRIEEQQERIEELEEEKEELETGISEKVDSRSFMKMVGLGAGGLALASPAASWVSWGGGGSTDKKQNLSEVLKEGNDISGKDIVDGGTTVWDTSAGQIPASQIQQGDGSGLDADSVDTQEPPFGAPSGAISIWYGSISNIQSGWVLCDGNNSTPNLQRLC
ncbi:MAG: hypothetical protein ABEJ95_04415 [Candidatus Nanohalobium sp.]